MKENAAHPAPTPAASLAELAAVNARLAAENERLKIENKLLGQKIDFLTRKLFGQSAERLDPRQLQLELQMQGMAAADEPPTPPPPAPPAPRSARTPRKDRLPADLPVVIEYLDPPEVLAEPDAYRCIGQEQIEQLDVEPPKFTRRVLVRRRYVRKDDRDAAPVIAPAPPRLIANSFASASLLAEVVLAKYVDHIPLYRQTLRFARSGIEISRQTLSDWMMFVGNWFLLIAARVLDELKATGYLQIDETMIRYLQPGKGRAQQGYLWVYHSPGAGVFFDWHPSRGAKCLERTLAGYTGKMQTDGYAAYIAWLTSIPREERPAHAKCWAHVRREFFEAADDSWFARWMVAQIAHLYGVEKRLRDTGAGPGLRVVVRNADSRMTLERIHRMLERHLTKHLPQGPTGKAIAYALGQWEGLLVYLEHGEIEIDNNGVENAIRPTAVGKKNYLFFGAEGAGKQSAAIYTLVGTCRILGVDVRAYLNDVFTRLPGMTRAEAETLTPAQWLAARRKKSTAA
jgi:transposase